MTLDDARALGLRAVAAGFPLFDGHDEEEAWPPNGDRDDDGVLWDHCNTTSTFWPDFRDPATRGVLLERVREKFGDPFATTKYVYPGCSHRWECQWTDWINIHRGSGVTREGFGNSEAEAMVCALGLAPSVFLAAESTD